MARFDTKPKQVRTRGGGGPKFVLLCDKVIIECPLNGNFVTYINAGKYYIRVYEWVFNLKNKLKTGKINENIFYD